MQFLNTLSLKIASLNTVPSAPNFRPPSWPPPPDWAPVLDEQGKPLCLYQDALWPLRGWGGKQKLLNFGDGIKKSRAAPIDKLNADLLRILMTWRIWGPRGARTVGNIKNSYDPLRAIAVLCSEEGILASDLVRFPAVAKKIPLRIPSSKYRYALTVLHDLYDAREVLGFVLIDRIGLANLAKAAPDHKTEQTPFIPPRIWTYQVNRLRSCLNDFFLHRENLERCFHFVCDAYAQNYGSLANVFLDKSRRANNPFQAPGDKIGTGVRSGKVFYGPFHLTEERFGLVELFDRWLGKENRTTKSGIRRLSKYLSLVSLVGLKYIINFSLMRVNEAWNLREDCLVIENDEKLGDIFLICGETTKTDPDSDARWPTSPSVKLAIEAMSVVALLRLYCAENNPKLNLPKDKRKNPYLIGPAHEPWSSDGGRGKANKKYRQSYQSYAVYAAKFPRLFDPEEMQITEQDLQLARLIEPSLNEEQFQVGLPWPLAYHQLRRTGAINMLSSGMVSEPSLQHQLKHAARAMTMYYGHNYGRLNLDAETRGIFLRTMYERLANEFAQLASSRFISPHGEARKTEMVEFMKVTDVKSLEAAGMRGDISAREIRLGFCLKRTSCPYGGLESTIRCGGGDTGTPCMDVLFDSKKIDQVIEYEADLDHRLGQSSENSPRRKALTAEKISLKNYYAIIHQKEC